jgi:hypothetical protein
MADAIVTVWDANAGCTEAPSRHAAVVQTSLSADNQRELIHDAAAK